MRLREQTGVPSSFSTPTWTRHPDQQASRQWYQQPAPSQGDEEVDGDHAQYTTRLPSSARRYQYRTEDQPLLAVASQQPRTMVRYHSQDIPPRRSSTQSQPAVPPSSPARPRLHWLMYVGIAMLVMSLGWILLSMLMNWWQVTQDDWRYGRPRTFQVDARVGHGDATTPSHFIVMNLNRHIIVIEFPGGDPSKARIYVGPTLFGDGQDLTPVTLEFKDVNGDGQPDMLIHIGDQTIVFLNDHGTFRPLRPGEHVTL